jgi:hypothetical protein
MEKWKTRLESTGIDTRETEAYLSRSISMLWTNATAKRWRVYEVKQTAPEFGGKPAMYFEVEGQRQAVPPLLGARVGDFITVVRKGKHDDEASIEADQTDGAAAKIP